VAFEFDTDGRLLVRDVPTSTFVLGATASVVLGATANVSFTSQDPTEDTLLDVAPAADSSTSGANVSAVARPVRSFAMRFLGEGSAAASSAQFQIFSGGGLTARQGLLFSWNAALAAGEAETAMATSVLNVSPVFRGRVVGVDNVSAAIARSASIVMFSNFN